MKPKLYQYAACPFCSKVTSMLSYKKVDYDVIEVNPLNKKEIQFSKTYRKVPIYVDTQGHQVNDSNKIMKRIDEEFPNPLVYASDENQKTKDEKWLAWSEKLVQGLPTVIYSKLSDSIHAFDYITKTGKFSWIQSRMIKYSGAFIMSLVAKKIRKRESITDPKAFLEKKIQEWVDGLAGQEFMGGTAPSIADIAVFGISRAVGSLRAGEIFRANQAFSDWLERMQNVTSLTLSVV